ncbi:hypothetical protein ACRALDRAFT_1077204 [Sodiomyces alcalophilus JCM 7366]|uniref:uncharacterized protein n=1 Tax=Sodiomyces alcalophilus JCM 7366 TaxID=591952 RepID=UPI0039B4B2DA
MNTTSQPSAERLPGQEHIPIYPRGFIALRVIQLVLAVVALGLSAFIVHYVPFDAAALMLFVSIATIITATWLLGAHLAVPKYYNYWAVLGMDIFLAFFWLISFAILADRTALLFGIFTSYYCGVIGCYEPTDLGRAVASVMAANSGLGGLQFLLFVTSLAIHGVALHRHRKAGLHCKPLDGTAHTIAITPGVVNPDDAEKNATVSAATNPAYSAPMSPQEQVQAPYPYDPNLNRAASPPVADYYPPGVQQPQPFYPGQQQTSPALTVQPTVDGSLHQTPSPQGPVLEQAAVPVDPHAHEVPGQPTYQQHPQA